MTYACFWCMEIVKEQEKSDALMCDCGREMFMVPDGHRLPEGKVRGEWNRMSKRYKKQLQEIAKRSENI